VVPAFETKPHADRMAGRAAPFASAQDAQLEAVRPLNDGIIKSTDDPDSLCQPES